MSYWRGKRAVVTGGSAGLGRALAGALVERGARVALVARGREQLNQAADDLRSRGANVLAVAADVTSQVGVGQLAASVQSAWGGVDLLCNCAGRSMRGTVLTTPAEKFQELWEANVISAVRCTQAFLPALAESHGHVVLIGSLASKAAAGYLGAYAATKFPLAALAQQLRLELGEAGPHVLLVCPGPIAREGNVADSGAHGRYVADAADATDVPAAAHRPAAGAKLRAIDPLLLSERILRACERRQAELVVPARARLLFAISQLSPRLGDWLLRRMTSG
jgi:short-subunit dehydrogenase